MPQTVRLNKILIYAREEAERLQNKEVLAEHLLLGILRLGEGGAYDVLTRCSLNPEAAKSDIDQALRVDDSDTLQPVVRSTQVERILRIAENESRSNGHDAVESVDLLLAILHERINRAAVYLETTWSINYEYATSMLFPDRQSSVRAGAGTFNNIEDAPGSQPSQGKSRPQGTNRGTPALEKYGRDMTRMAEQGLLDPVVGREVEVERVIQILSRRKKNNPILIGEPGVGKSAIVEGLALRIVSGEAIALKGKRIVTLDIASMVAGTTYRGQFEERMKTVIQELHAHPEIILFIDEIHTIIGAGNAQGSLDAANILKPALARGEVQCIGATTTTEYAKSIEKDGALERRFQKVMVRPTTSEETLLILERLSDTYSAYHQVVYPQESLEACVKLAERYLTDRAFPDKAIDVLDEVGAQLGKRRIEVADADDTRLPEVHPDDVAHVVSMMSGVPVQRVQSTENERLRGMADAIRKHVIGQDEAIDKVVRAIQRSRLGLRDAKRPIGTFFFLGQTGVGKTHLAQVLAEEMFGSKDALIRVDMSEYQEKHTVSLLVGAPPGYVAHEEGGKLTEAVRRKPYSIVLFDEIEKAHPDIFNVLLQVLDEGRLTDRQGRFVDFRNTIIILTSNVGTRQLKEFGGGIGFGKNELDEATTQRVLEKALEKTFPPEFVNRIDNVITFRNLSEESLLQILDIEIAKLSERLAAQGYTLLVTDAVRRQLIHQGDCAKYGARPIRRAVQTYLEDKITEQMLSGKADRDITI